MQNLKDAIVVRIYSFVFAPIARIKMCLLWMKWAERSGGKEFISHCDCVCNSEQILVPLSEVTRANMVDGKCRHGGSRRGGCDGKIERGWNSSSSGELGLRELGGGSLISLGLFHMIESLDPINLFGLSDLNNLLRLINLTGKHHVSQSLYHLSNLINQLSPTWSI